MVILLGILILALIVFYFIIRSLEQDVEMYRQSAYDNNRNYQIVESKFSTVLERLGIAINKFNDTYSNTQLEMATDLLCRYQDENEGAFKIIDLDEDESNL
jgi:hypothetical protein